MQHLTFFFWMPHFFTGSVLIMFCLACFLYFLPTIVASNRRNPNIAAIFALNFFAGWTFIGWIIALVMALASSRNHIDSGSRSYDYDNEPRHSYQSNNRTQQEKIDQVRQLKQLLDEGALTYDEFNRQKAMILG